MKEGGIEGKEMEGERDGGERGSDYLEDCVISATWETEAGGLQSSTSA